MATPWVFFCEQILSCLNNSTDEELDVLMLAVNQDNESQRSTHYYSREQCMCVWDNETCSHYYSRELCVTTRLAPTTVGRSCFAPPKMSQEIELIVSQWKRKQELQEILHNFAWLCKVYLRTIDSLALVALLEGSKWQKGACFCDSPQLLQYHYLTHLYFQ